MSGLTQQLRRLASYTMPNARQILLGGALVAASATLADAVLAAPDQPPPGNAYGLYKDKNNNGNAYAYGRDKDKSAGLGARYGAPAPAPGLIFGAVALIGGLLMKRKTKRALQSNAEAR